MIQDIKKLCNLMFTYLKGQAHVIIVGFITALIFSLVGLATPPYSMRNNNYRYVFDRSNFRLCINQII